MVKLSILAFVALQGASAVRVNTIELTDLHEGSLHDHHEDSVLAADRRAFLRHVKGEEHEREHYIVYLSDKVTEDDFLDYKKMKGVELVGSPKGLAFLEFKGTPEEFKAFRAKLGDAVANWQEDQPMGIPIGEEPLEESKMGTGATAGGSAADSDADMCMESARLIGREHRTRTGKGVHVYVADTGIRVSHSDFRKADSVYETRQFSFGYDDHDCAAFPDEVCDSDPHGHGTHVAGTVAGIRYGVAPDAHLHSVKVLNAQGSGAVSWAIAGLNYVMNKGQKPGVVSMSIGAPNTPGNGFVEALQTVMDAGYTVVTASGNNRRDACDYVPAGVSRVITVGSVGWPFRDGLGAVYDEETESFFSNDGRCVDILAPGELIWSASSKSDTSITRKTGTSMACPHVSGVAAMILEENPSKAPAAVWDTMQASYSANGAVTNLKDGTVNRRLKIGAKGAFCSNSKAAGRAAISTFAVFCFS